MCSDLPRHQCLFSSARCSYPLSFALVIILETFSTTIPVLSAWRCAFLAPASRCHLDFFAALVAGICAVTLAWFFLFFIASPAGILASLLHFSDVSLPRCLGCSFCTQTYPEGPRGNSLPATCFYEVSLQWRKFLLVSIALFRSFSVVLIVTLRACV